MPSHFSLDEFTIQLDPRDNIAIARQDIQPACQLTTARGTLTTRQAVPAGHKLALRPIASGLPIIRYGYPIGVASHPIQPGDWVHTHNVSLPPGQRDLSFTLSQRSTLSAPRPSKTFLGFARQDGQVGTRNLIAVISTVSCSAQTALAIAAHFTPQQLAEYPNVDGVVAVVHHTGCSITPDGLAFTYLQRCLLNLAHHPNIGGVIFISLGCEVMQIGGCLEQTGSQPRNLERNLSTLAPILSIQELGGIEATRRAGIRAVEGMLPAVNASRRSPQPLSGLKIALQCGGSDGWSGVTANPLLGLAVDELVEKLRQRLGCPVMAAYNEFCPPTIAEAIDQAIRIAKPDPRLSIIAVKTIIGFGPPTRAGTEKAHGEPPGDKELNGAKENLGWPLEPEV